MNYLRVPFLRDEDQIRRRTHNSDPDENLASDQEAGHVIPTFVQFEVGDLPAVHQDHPHAGK